MIKPPNFHQPQTLGRLNVPTFQAAVNEVADNDQAPYDLVQFAALTALSIAIQGAIDVRTPADTIVPASLYIMPVAASGERKSRIDNEFLHPVREFEYQQNASYQEDDEVYSADHEVWSLKQRALRRAYQKKVMRGEDASEEQANLHGHLKLEPVRPKRTRLLYEETTKSALLLGLHQGSPSGGLISSEGSTILNGPLFNNEQAIANALWSGSPFIFDRVSSPSFILKDVRLTISVMVQPDVMQRYWEEKGDKARGTGLLARMLVCNTGSTQGSRFIRNTELQWTCRDRFRQRLTEILESYAEKVKSPDFKREIVQFCPEAKTVWIGYFNEVERSIQPGGCYAMAGDHASKLADNVARVAALLHYFEGFPGDISAETVRAAILIVSEASRHFMEMFILPPPTDVLNAQALHGWLIGRYNQGQQLIRKNEARQSGPLRERDALDRAIAVLVQAGKVAVTRINKTRMLVVASIQGGI